MKKSYSYYPVCFDDITVGENGGMSVNKDNLLSREPMAVNTDVRTLMAEVRDKQQAFDSKVTGVFSKYDDPVNDVSYIIHGNHYLENIGVITPMVSDWAKSYS